MLLTRFFYALLHATLHTVCMLCLYTLVHAPLHPLHMPSPHTPSCFFHTVHACSLAGSMHTVCMLSPYISCTITLHALFVISLHTLSTLSVLLHTFLHALFAHHIRVLCMLCAHSLHMLHAHFLCRWCGLSVHAPRTSHTCMCVLPMRPTPGPMAATATLQHPNGVEGCSSSRVQYQISDFPSCPVSPLHAWARTGHACIPQHHR